MSKIPQKRYEMKYLVGKAYGEVIKTRLNALLTPDPLALKDGKYHIRSVYFDDSEQNSYYEKMAGIETRQKIRIRHYNYDNSFIVLEKKAKNDDFILKRSLRIDPVIMNDILRGDYETLKRLGDEEAMKFYAEMTAEHIFPVIGVGYDRTAFLFKNTDVRITVDENIYYFNPVDDSFDMNIPVIRDMDDSVVLEVKFGKFLPEIIDDILSDVPMLKESFSKYIVCSDLKGIY